MRYLVKTLVVNTRAKHLDGRLAASPLEFGHLAFHDSIPFGLPHQVYLVHQKKHVRIFAELRQPLQAVLIVLQILFHLAGLDIEHIDHHPYMREDDGALRTQVRIHECILATTVPEIEDEVAEEADVVLLDVNRSAETGSEGRRVIGTEERSASPKRQADRCVLTISWTAWRSFRYQMLPLITPRDNDYSTWQNVVVRRTFFFILEYSRRYKERSGSHKSCDYVVLSLVIEVHGLRAQTTPCRS